MYLVKRKNKEKIYLYDSEADYLRSLSVEYPIHAASFYCQWAHNCIHGIRLKSKTSDGEIDYFSIIQKLIKTFSMFSRQNYMGLEFQILDDVVLSEDFSSMIDVKRLLKI